MSVKTQYAHVKMSVIEKTREEMMFYCTSEVDECPVI